MEIEMTVAESFRKIGVIPVVALDHEEDALPLAEALMEGGLPAAEVTFRTDAARESIRKMHEEFPDMLVGAGTVLTTEQVNQAVDAGASFIVSPGFDPEIVDYCIARKIPVFPGVVTPSEVAQAVKRGLGVVKFFPAEAYGGLGTINALAAPYGNLLFMPTGGINPANLRNYLANDKIIACGGTWMVKKDMIAEGRFDEIKKLSEEAASIVREMRG